MIQIWIILRMWLLPSHKLVGSPEPPRGHGLSVATRKGRPLSHAPGPWTLLLLTARPRHAMIFISGYSYMISRRAKERRMEPVPTLDEADTGAPPLEALKESDTTEMPLAERSAALYARFFQVLSDPTRVRLLHLLLEAPETGRTVSELVAASGRHRDGSRHTWAACAGVASSSPVARANMCIIASLTRACASCSASGEP